MEATRPATRVDEVALYVTTAVALAATGVAVGAGSGSASVGVTAAVLCVVGTLVSWRTRSWPLARGLTLGVVLGVVAAALLQNLIAWEIEMEASAIHRIRGDPALEMAFRMLRLAVILSFTLVRAEMLPFVLVPSLSAFGLVGGRGSALVVGSCFAVFFPAALGTLGQAMLLTGLQGESAPSRWRRQPRAWRRRHWLTLGAIAAVIMVLGYLLFVPVEAYGTQYAFYLPIDLRTRGSRLHTRLEVNPSQATSFPVGRGPVLLGDTPVLSVEGPLAEYWRGETFSDYTGTAWRAASTGRRHLPVRGGALDVTDLFPPVSEGRLQTHGVRAEVDLPFIVIAPGQVRRFKLSGGPRVHLGEEGVVVDQAGCIAAPDAVLPAGSEYEVTSAPLHMSRRRSAPPTDIGAGLGETHEMYLSIPLGAREVADLARDVVGDTEEPLDRLAALVTYLQQNYVYTRNAPAIPTGEDAAGHFLFHQKRGQCDLFATALAVMARSVGIPTRVVTGYAGGEYDADTGRLVLRESDAHAWVEAYVAPWGWLSADATPAGELPPIPPLHRAMLSLRFFVQDHPYWAGALGAVLVLAAVAAIAHARRRRLAPVMAGGGMDGPRGIVVQAYARLCHLLARHGAPRRASQTPLEFVTALESGELPRMSQKARPLPPGVLTPVRALSHIFVTARYGPGPVTEDLAESAVQRLAEANDCLRSKTP